MRVLALTRYERLGSSSRVRFYQYFPHLKEQGLEITSAPFFNDDYVRSLYAGKATSFAAVLRAYLERVAEIPARGRADALPNDVGRTSQCATRVVGRTSQVRHAATLRGSPYRRSPYGKANARYSPE